MRSDCLLNLAISVTTKTILTNGFILKEMSRHEARGFLRFSIYQVEGIQKKFRSEILAFYKNFPQTKIYFNNRIVDFLRLQVGFDSLRGIKARKCFASLHGYDNQVTPKGLDHRRSRGGGGELGGQVHPFRKCTISQKPFKDKMVKK